MTDHFLSKAKAYAALVGSVLTVLISQIPDDGDTKRWLGIALAVCTAVATFAIPNKDPKALHQDESVQPPR